MPTRGKDREQRQPATLPAESAVGRAGLSQPVPTLRGGLGPWSRVLPLGPASGCGLSRRGPQQVEHL